MDRARSTNGEKRNAYRILVEKPEGKRLRSPCRDVETGTVWGNQLVVTRPLVREGAPHGQDTNCQTVNRAHTRSRGSKPKWCTEQPQHTKK
jgi:hypothetical protein